MPKSIIANPFRVRRSEEESGRIEAEIPELSPRTCQLALDFFHPMELLFRPAFSGLEQIPNERPLMFVGNHQFLSFDTPFLVAQLWRHEIFVRALGDDFLFSMPGIAQFLSAYGVLPGSPQLATTLLQRGESILVYPGGAREASKNAGHEEELDWWDRLGFARLALRERCTIVPVAATGVDDRIKILLAPESYLNSSLGQLIDRMHLRRDMFLPFFVPKGLPQPSFHICPAISAEPYLYRDPESASRSLRSDVAEAIENGLVALHSAQNR